MLLSLDQFSLAPPQGPLSAAASTTMTTAAYDDFPTRLWANDAASSRRRSRANKSSHGSSSSDVFDPVSTPIPHSNTTPSDFHTQLLRLGVVRDEAHRSRPGTSPRASAHVRPARHRNGSSGSASIDAAYSAPNRHSRPARRSASFDHGLSAHALRRLNQLSPPRADLAPRHEDDGDDYNDDQDYNDRDDDDDYSAAPMPTIPSGPRREPSTPLRFPPPPPEPADSRSSDRKRSSSRSTKSSTARSKPSTGHRTTPATATSPVMARAEAESAPAPSQRERPGFFRRVFGGGSSRTNLAAAANAGSHDPNNKAHQQPHQPPLQKKSSNFFRRRKKSAVDETPAPPNLGSLPPLPSLDTVALPAAAAREVAASAQKSPTSSLRIVMNPYLNGGAAGLGLSSMEGYRRGFTPEYEPSPNARIRTVHSEDGGARLHEADGTPDRAAAQRSRETSETGDSSFLDLDGCSDNELGSPERQGDKGSVKGKRKMKHQKKQTSKDADNKLAGLAQHEQDPDATIRGNKHAPALSGQDDREPNRPCLAPPSARATSPRSLGSTSTGYKTAPSAPPSVLVESTPDESGARVLSTLESIQSDEPLDEPEFVVGEPTEDDRQKARKIYDGGQGFIQKEKAASWMGEEGPVRQRTLQAYMELYDFKDKSVLGALRSVCGRLVLRAETQQVDRILVAFSKRWCLCNPYHGFKATDVIHTICYSIMLLNTDLHLADIEQKMTRSQFVKNTMTTIMQAVAESAPGAFGRPSILPEKSSILGGDHGRASPDPERVLRRSSFLPRSDTQGSLMEDCGPLVKAPFHGSLRAWEEQVELVLKNIYASIRDQRLPLFGAEPDKHLGAALSQNSLSVMGMLKRSPSVLSKSPSETQLSSRGRVAESSRTSVSRWTSKSRSRPGIGRNGFSSSRTSFDDGHSVWSPAMSSATWSRYSLGRTQGSASQDSFAPTRPRGDYQQSVGFANALSQAIVREDEAAGNDNAPSILSSDVPAGQLLEDETLELAGPPWVKEGMVVHKHHLDGVGKKARDRNWTEVFAVAQKGQLSLFSFTANKSAARQKGRARNAPSGPVGGGNWQDSAVCLGTFNLRLTLASALPPPGYSRTRPHVWALSLPTGAVHLFQVGTPEIIREFVHTANYWSARLSSHPFVGGISNVEYGWSESIVNNALVTAVNESTAAEPTTASGARPSRPGSSAAHARKSSIASGSFRASSFDQVAGSFAQGSGRGGKLPGDRIHIAEWAPPTQSMRPSKAAEAEQLDTLVAYVKSIEADLQTHNQLRSPMLLAFTPRGHNAGKAMANWERKSAYLLREIVKFRTYVDCLQQAEARKREVYAERNLAHKAARGELSDGDMDVSDGEEADETLRPA
ncbi:sec7 domain-containing protein [Hirsutella rhossiliensis]|uniref:Sec7 domain-containing protein n=1 Tax=Hirsutella rhossiliensis TaxID=111463 RepID=A0A9P8SLS4_9HYPO|nr:sec7 domain-containing protein [Hirsutella rhossiliensis]KAH0965451.1 sec7 domain-containing protein [Hirsutella rhossiliensis]